MEDGRRLENFTWRLWTFETFRVEPQCSCSRSLHAEMPPLSTSVDATALGGETEKSQPHIRPFKTQNDIRGWRAKHIMSMYLTQIMIIIELLRRVFLNFSPRDWPVSPPTPTSVCAFALHSLATVLEHNASNPLCNDSRDLPSPSQVSTANIQSQQKPLLGKREHGIFFQHSSVTEGLIEHPTGNQAAPSSIDSAKNSAGSPTSKQTKRDDNDTIETKEDFWEDCTENSEPSVDEKLFQRMEPIPAPGQSLLTMMMRQERDIANSHPLGAPHSPRTTRRKMISQELPKQLREYLLTERTKNRAVLPNKPRGPGQSSYNAQSMPGNEVLGCSVTGFIKICTIPIATPTYTEYGLQDIHSTK